MARHEHALRVAHRARELRSGMSGSGGRVASGNGHGSHPTDRNSRAPHRDTPYRVASTTAGQWTTGVAHNTTRIFRDER